MIMITGFIGAGRVGVSLGKYLSDAGVPLAGYYDLSAEAAASAAEFTHSGCFDSPQALAARCSLLFLTTPDSFIQKAWEQIRNAPLEGRIICHCSGALPSDAFDGIEDARAFACSLHPLLPFSSRFSSYEMLKNGFFTIEGHPRARKILTDLLTGLGNTVCEIDGSCKPKYHAAASILSNQLTAVLDTGYRLLEECGFTREQAVGATRELIRQNVENIFEKDCEQALTGPIERNDLQTVEKHLKCLDGKDRTMYRILGLKLTEIAKRKHPDADYDGLAKLLEETGPQA